MAPITSSFVGDIQQAMIAELERCMGVGTSVFPDPAYLLLQQIRPGNPTSPNRIEEANMPAVVIVPFGRLPGPNILGMRDAFRTEQFVVYVLVNFTKASVGYTGSDQIEFKNIVHASMGELQERLRYVLANYDFSVTDPTWGLSAGSHDIGKASEYYDYVDDWKVNAVGWLEINVAVERT